MPDDMTLEEIIEKSREDPTDVEGREAIGAPPEPEQDRDSNVEIVGAIPLENTVIVKNKATGLTYKVEATPELAEQAKTIAQLKEIGAIDDDNNFKDITGITTALTSGITERQLKDVGISERVIRTSKDISSAMVQMSPFITSDGRYDVSAALQANVPLSIISNVVGGESLAQYRRQLVSENQDEALNKITQYRNNDGSYDLVKYFRESGKDVMTINLAENTLINAGFKSDDVKKSRYLAFAYPSTIGEFQGEKGDIHKIGFFEQKLLNTQEWASDFRKNWIESVEEKRDVPEVLRQALLGTGGSISFLATYFPNMVFSTGDLIAHPTKIPSAVKSIGKGIKANIQTLNPYEQANPYDVAMATARISMLIASVYEGVKRLSVYVLPQGKPVALISKELSTGRIPIEGFDTDELGDAMGEVMRQASEPSGASSGDVPIGNTGNILHYLKTPYQREIGNVLWHGSKEGLGFMDDDPMGFSAGQGGLYSDPWAALDYARSDNPGITLIITDTSKFKEVPSDVLQNVSQSDAFIRGAKPGAYPPSKVWRGDFETEVVWSPGSKFVVPKPTADLPTRLLVGEYADFFTYDNGRFVPIKIAVDSALVQNGQLPALPSVADLYAVKMFTLQNTLQNFSEALKHPDLMLSDIVKGTAAALDDPRDIFGSNIGGTGTLPGLRDVYLVTDWGTKISNLAKDLWESVKGDTVQQAIQRGISPSSATYQALLRENLGRAYSANIATMLASWGGATEAYNSDSALRQKFEDIYVNNLGRSVESLAKTTAVMSSTLEDVARDAKERIAYDYKDYSPFERVRSESEGSLSSVESPVSEIGTPKTEEPRPMETEEPRSEERSSEETKREESRVTEDERSSQSEDRRTESVIETQPYEDSRPTYDSSRPFEPDKRFVPSDDIGRTAREKILPGTIEWRQGKKWVVLYPPYRDPEDKAYLDYPLPGTYKFAVGKGSAAKTLQVLGGAPAQDAVIDMGWATVKIKSKGGQMEMSFEGGDEAIAQRWADERAMDAYERQSYEALPRQFIQRIPRIRRKPVNYVREPDIIEEENPDDFLLRPEYRPLPRPMKQIKQTGLQERYYLGYKLRPSNLDIAV
jgi:hypothetical protein